MKLREQQRALQCAVGAARAAGALMRKNLRLEKKVNSATLHDIKLDLDVRCQKLIERQLRRQFPKITILGEEGISGNAEAEQRWVVDPIDGTVNFTYGIPHACVSIALQIRKEGKSDEVDYTTMLGVVYDPFAEELWTAIRGGPAKLNGRVIRVSRNTQLCEATVSIGFAKSRNSLQQTLPYFNRLVQRVRKVRIMGSAALALTYVATGRFDAYIERGIRLWDIAAGGLIVECAGGEFWREPIAGKYAYSMLASNGRLRKKLEALKR
jgi:myo-inositol-1(or 4)-monophosphatase